MIWYDLNWPDISVSVSVSMSKKWFKLLKWANVRAHCLNGLKQPLYSQSQFIVLSSQNHTKKLLLLGLSAHQTTERMKSQVQFSVARKCHLKQHPPTRKTAWTISPSHVQKQKTLNTAPVCDAILIGVMGYMKWGYNFRICDMWYEIFYVMF